MTPLVSMFTGNPGSKSRRPVAIMPSIQDPSGNVLAHRFLGSISSSTLERHKVCTVARH